MKKKLWNAHRWVGLTMSLFLIGFSVTGFLLRHTSLLHESPKDESPFTGIPKHISIHPLNPRLWFLVTNKRLYASYDEGTTFSEIRLKYPLGGKVTVAFSPFSSEECVLALENGKILFTKNQGKIWEDIAVPIETPLIKGIQWRSSEGWVLLTDSFLFQTNDKGKYWEKTARFSNQHRLHYWIYRLHAGELWRPVLGILYDIATLGFVFLGLSGVYLFFKR